MLSLTDLLINLQLLLDQPISQILLTGFFVYLFCHKEIKAFFN